MKVYPINVYLFSGKRKSGKDFITDKLSERLNDVVVIKISGPIKSHWAKEKNLSFDNLLESSEYKENHRKDMIAWGESVRNKDYGYFCSAAVKMYNAETKPIWIVSDIRRKTDIKWFKEQYGNSVVNIRIVCDDNVRETRGWKFTEGVDDKESECDLDDYKDWDMIIDNSGKSDINDVLNKLIVDIEKQLKS